MVLYAKWVLSDQVALELVDYLLHRLRKAPQAVWPIPVRPESVRIRTTYALPMKKDSTVSIFIAFPRCQLPEVGPNVGSYRSAQHGMECDFSVPVNWHKSTL